MHRQPTSTSLRQGQTLYFLAHPMFHPQHRYFADCIHIATNEVRDQLTPCLIGGPRFVPGSVHSLSRRAVEAVAKGLNARLDREREQHRLYEAKRRANAKALADYVPTPIGSRFD